MTPSTYKLIYPQKGEWFTVTLVDGKYVGIWNDFEINAKFENGFVQNGTPFLRFIEPSATKQNLSWIYEIKLEDIATMKREFVPRDDCDWITNN